MTFGVTGKEIQLYQVHFGIAVTTSSIYIYDEITTLAKQLCCAARNIGVRIFAIFVLITMRINRSTFGHELNLVALILANAILSQIVVQFVVFANLLILILI